MIARLVDLSVAHRYLVLLFVSIAAAFGIYQLSALPIDAVPDITNKQVIINSLDPALGPLDMEKRVTFPVETALAGIPGLVSTRSISRNGFSQITAVFADSVDIYFARQQVAERLAQARDQLPSGVQPAMGPVSTGLGEVLTWSIRYKQPRKVTGVSGWQADGSYRTPEGEILADPVAQAAYLRTVQSWIVAPQIKSVPGIAGVDSIGGYEKQFLVQPDPARLAAYGISFEDLAASLEKANISVGANFIERGGEASLIRADARIRTIEEITRSVIATKAGVPVTVADVASVKIGGELRTGAGSENGDEAVIGTALMLVGENSRTVSAAVAAKLEDVSKSLPAGIALEVVYNRAKLVDATIATVQKNLIEGALLVIVALFLLLGNIRAALITALVIPLSFLLMAIGMTRLGVSGNLMSLGALDFGLIVDGAVIIVENFLRRMSERQHETGRLLSLAERLQEVTDAVKEMVRPTLFGQAIIFIVFIPLLTFQGVEGKTFSPMAITVMLALAGAFVLSLTFVPAMLALLITGKVEEKEVRVIAFTKAHYIRGLAWARNKPLVAIGTAVGVFVAAFLIFGGVGREFMPQLDEKDFSLEIVRIPSTSLNTSVQLELQLERELLTFPEVERVVSKNGTAEVASDPMPPSSSDALVMLKPHDKWPDPSMSKAELIEKIDRKLSKLVGSSYSFSQPIQQRFNELIAGVRGDVAIKVYGEDLEQMTRIGDQIATILRSIPGAADVRVEQTGGFPTLDLQFDRAAISAAGLTIDEVTSAVSTALGGKEAGQVFEGDRRFSIVVRLSDPLRNNLDAIGALPITLPDRGQGIRQSVPLRTLVHFANVDGLNQISRENGKRRVVVQSNVRGTDAGSYTSTAKAKVNEQLRLPPGVFLEWGGQSENLKAAQARIAIVVPICAAVILLLLFMALGDILLSAVIFATVPLALAGGVFALLLTSQLFSISAAVGFIALSGVAILNGLVMMTSIQSRLAMGNEIGEAVSNGAIERFRSVVMTAVVPSLGFVPMAIAHGTGAEVQKPLAVVVIGGLMTATILTLFVLPVLTEIALRWRERRTTQASIRPQEAAKFGSST
ncbi:efflux RND transporter permease subunit [Sphingomonas sp. RB1R13]|uniref:efflux RND transporter permease subunit n=1 Tax=Sphingomonas sp. RB1R13 TaxID=3096159 RepID=UPI002FCAEC6E